MQTFAQLCGLLGVVAILLAYFLLQTKRSSPESLRFLLLNLVGALLVIVSLTQQWNLAAFLLEAAWAWVSIYGLYTHIYLPWKRKQ